jgi:hypothetical protein
MRIIKFLTGPADNRLEQVSATGIIAGLCRSRIIFERSIALAAVLAGFLAAAGCQTKSMSDPIFGPDYSATNAFRKEAVLPATVRRVAVLPLSFNERDSASVSGEQLMEPVFKAELNKASRFETVYVTPTQLELWTGRERWDDFEQLPPDLLRILGEKTGCDGVLFARLTQFKAYPPILVGWRMKLVALDADILWSVDELFDAAEEPVSNSARRYSRGRVKNNPVLEDSRSILLAPSSFGQYTLHAVFDTLPHR